MANAFFMKIDGITGESEDESHKGWLEITEFGQEMAHDIEGGGTPSAAGGFTTGGATLEVMSFNKAMDRSSVQLFQYCLTAKVIPTIVIEAVRPTEKAEVYFRITLTNSIVASINTTGSDGELPTEEGSIAFTTIKWEYTMVKPDGKMGDTFSSTWNRLTNRQT